VAPYLEINRFRSYGRTPAASARRPLRGARTASLEILRVGFKDLLMAYAEGEHEAEVVLGDGVADAL
jgi:hypothetical protein